MSRQKLFLSIWSALLLCGAVGVFFYIKLTTEVVFSTSVTPIKQLPLDMRSGGIGSWFDRLTGKKIGDLYPAIEATYTVDIGEQKNDDREYYHILSISKLDEEQLQNVEARLKSLNLLYSVNKEKSNYSVNISFRDKESMNALIDELKKTL